MRSQCCHRYSIMLYAISILSPLLLNQETSQGEENWSRTFWNYFLIFFRLKEVISKLILSSFYSTFPSLDYQQFFWHYSEWDWQTCSLANIHECHVLHLLAVSLLSARCRHKWMRVTLLNYHHSMNGVDEALEFYEAHEERPREREKKSA